MTKSLKACILNTMQKKCSRCHKIKNISEFRRSKRTDDGYLIWCKECKKKYPKEYEQEYWMQYLQEHREKILNRGRAYYQEHRESILEKAQEPLSRDKRRKYWEKYYAENREEILAQDKKYHQQNKDKISARARFYRETHKEELRKKRHERYLQIRHTSEYKLRKIISDTRRRARLENCEINDFTSKQAKLLLEKSTHCPICSERFLKNDKRALDHIVPLSKGGNNTLLNIWVTHFSCNIKKGNRHYANYGNGQLLLFPSFQESPFKKPEPIILTEKKCLHCGIIKPIDMFSKNKTAKDGRLGTCKRCMKIYQQKHGKEYQEKRRKYFAEHPEKRLEQLEKRRQWRKEQVEKDPDYYKKLYYKYHEDKLIYAKEYQEKHKEYYQEYGRKYYRKNRVLCIQLTRGWAVEHKDRVQEYGKHWRAEHPDYMKNYYWVHKTRSQKSYS